MTITSIEIQKKEFKKSFRGYNPLEVRAFLESLAKEFSILHLQIKSLNEQLIENEVQLRDFNMIEKTLQQTMLNAHQISEKTLENARIESKNILDSADERRNLILDEAYFEIKKTKEEVVRLQSKRDALVSRLKILLSSELELITQIEKIMTKNRFFAWNW